MPEDGDDKISLSGLLGGSDQNHYCGQAADEETCDASK